MKFDMALCGGILHTSRVQLGSDTTANCDIPYVQDDNH